MGQFFRILLASPRLTIAIFLMIGGGIGGALKSRETEVRPSTPWSQDESFADGSSAGEWGKDTRSASARPTSRAAEEPRQQWKNEDGVIFEEEDVKALDPSEYEQGPA